MIDPGSEHKSLQAGKVVQDDDQFLSGRGGEWHNTQGEGQIHGAHITRRRPLAADAEKVGWMALQVGDRIWHENEWRNIIRIDFGGAGLVLGHAERGTFQAWALDDTQQRKPFWRKRAAMTVGTEAAPLQPETPAAKTMVAVRDLQIGDSILLNSNEWHTITSATTMDQGKTRGFKTVTDRGSGGKWTDSWSAPVDFKIACRRGAKPHDLGYAVAAALTPPRWKQLPRALTRLEAVAVGLMADPYRVDVAETCADGQVISKNVSDLDWATDIGKKPLTIYSQDMSGDDL